MRILGIDPGYAIVGYGALDYSGGGFRVVEYGAITTPANTPMPDRLYTIYCDITNVLETLHPDCMAIERLYFNTNQKTAIDVAEARGVLLLAAKQAGVKIYEFTPLQVKQSVVGYGRAEKHQVMEMTKTLLGLKAIPKPDDTADALALAICCGHSALSPITNALEGTR